MQDVGVLGRATLSVTILLGILSIFVVATRFYVRISTKTLGVDDYLMALGCVSP